MTLSHPAEYFAVIVTPSIGKVKSVFNPDYDWQLATHRVQHNDKMLIFSKKAFGISLEPNSMNQAIVAKIVATVESLI